MRHEQLLSQNAHGRARRLAPERFATRLLIAALATACGSSIAFAGTSSSVAKPGTASSTAAAASKIAKSKRGAARRKKLPAVQTTNEKLPAVQVANGKSRLRDDNRNKQLGRTQDLEKLGKVNQGAGRTKLTEGTRPDSSRDRLDNPSDAFGKHGRFDDGTAGTPKLAGPGGLKTQSHNGNMKSQSGGTSLGSSSARDRKFAAGAGSSRAAQRDPTAVAKETDASKEAIDRGHDQQAESQEHAAETFILSKEARPALGDDAGPRNDPAAATERQRRVNDILRHVPNGNPGESGDGGTDSLQTVRPTDPGTIKGRISQPDLGDDSNKPTRSPTAGRDSVINRPPAP